MAAFLLLARLFERKVLRRRHKNQKALIALSWVNAFFRILSTLLVPDDGNKVKEKKRNLSESSFKRGEKKPQ